MGDQTAVVPSRAPRFSLDTWAVVIAAGFLLLIAAGILPRVPW